MEIQAEKLTKLCSFYVSDWHLVTMLLPYINNKINEEARISTILEKDVRENIEKLVEKLNLKNKEKILEINWTNNKEKIFNNMEDEKEKIIIINGTKEFIERKNEKLIKYINTHKINGKIKIINCYEIINYEGKITDILKAHNKILNTSGEKEIEEVFFDYNNKDSKIKVI